MSATSPEHARNHGSLGRLPPDLFFAPLPPQNVFALRKLRLATSCLTQKNKSACDVFSAQQHALAYVVQIPPVCLSHGRISQNRLKLWSSSFHHAVAPTHIVRDVSFRNSNGFPGSPEQGHQTRVGWGKQAIFLHLCLNISKMVRDTSKVTAND